MNETSLLPGLPASPDNEQIQTAYVSARREYLAFGVDTEEALKRALSTPISMHCWQADDITGLESLPGGGGGIMATGNYPGRARNGEEIRRDLDEVLKLTPGAHRLNLHAFYAEPGRHVVDRDELQPEHFEQWMNWAAERGMGMDFNPTYFSHPQAADGRTLSHSEEAIRSFWVRHGIACRRIGAAMARRTGTPCITNHWIPDGEKDSPADRWSPRRRLMESLDAIMDEKLDVDPEECVDSVESKLFGIGSEDYVVGSFEFYNNYALSRGRVLCLDMGHFHPTETIDDKLSALLQFHGRLLLHLSRPIRWDSDHVVILNDDLRRVFLELVRGSALERVFLALDFFDAGINRITAYVTGLRAARKALLAALLDPTRLLQQCEKSGRRGEKLALMEETRTLSLGAVWNELCRRGRTAAGAGWLAEVQRYEEEVLKERNC